MKLAECADCYAWRNPDSATCISGLLFLCNEAAIFWSVVSIYIDTLKREFVSVSVILGKLQEWLKRLPFFSEGYSASTVVLKGSGLWVTAAIFHMVPDNIKTSQWGVFTRLPMFCIGFLCSYSCVVGKTH
jgi:hypothetical protein